MYKRQVLGSAGKACLAFWLFFMGSGFGFVYFLGSAEAFAGIFTGFYTTPTNYTAENIVWVNPVSYTHLATAPGLKRAATSC